MDNKVKSHNNLTIPVCHLQLPSPLCVSIQTAVHLLYFVDVPLYSHNTVVWSRITNLTSKRRIVVFIILGLLMRRSTVQLLGTGLFVCITLQFKRKENMLPTPNSDSNQICPPICSTICLHIRKPKPVPPCQSQYGELFLIENLRGVL